MWHSINAEDSCEKGYVVITEAGSRPPVQWAKKESQVIQDGPSPDGQARTSYFDSGKPKHGRQQDEKSDVRAPSRQRDCDFDKSNTQQ
jgi:hypothetical protein